MPIKRKTQHRSVLTDIWLIVVFVLIHSKGIAHPGSHVDAWARIGKHLDIRVTLFLDDVMATQGIELSANGGHISLETAQRCLEQFEDTLGKMMVLYDADGHQLNSKITERPRWSVPSAGVDLSADAGLRLTWKLRYPWQLHQQSFSIRHRFVEQHLQPVSGAVELPLPAELRLRVRSAASARRIDGVIPHHQPHTILLHTPAAGVEMRLNHTPATVRFEVESRQLIHEFSLPVALISNVFLANTFSTDVENFHPAVNVGVIRTQATNWGRQYLELSIDGKRSIPQSVVVDLFTARNVPIASSRRVPFIGTRIRLRTVHPIRHSPRQVTVLWKRAPEQVYQLRVDTFDGDTRTTQLFDCRDKSNGPGTLHYLGDLSQITTPTEGGSLKPH